MRTRKRTYRSPPPAPVIKRRNRNSRTATDDMASVDGSIALPLPVTTEQDAEKLERETNHLTDMNAYFPDLVSE